jgi:two-component system sensor histidine kinase/response regulator
MKIPSCALLVTAALPASADAGATLHAALPLDVALPLAVALAVCGIALVLWSLSLRRAVVRRTREFELLHDSLTERLKERDALQAVFRASERFEAPLADVAARVAQALPPGFSRPDTVAVRVELDGETAATSPLDGDVALLEARICPGGRERGRIGVGWRPGLGGPAFLPEESVLVAAAGERLATYLQGRDALLEARRAREFAEAVLETANVMVLGLDEPGCVTYLNLRGEALTGYARTELIGKDWFATVVEAAGAATSRAEHVASHESGRNIPDFENAIVTRTGERREIRWSSHVVQAPDGRRVSIAFGVDVTAQREAECELARYRAELEAKVAARTAELATLAASLRASNEEQRAIFDAASAGIALFTNRVITHCNRTLEQMLGYEHGELTGRGSRVIYPDEETWARMGEEFHAAVARGEDFRREVELSRKDGSLLWCRMSGRYIDFAEEHRRYVALIDDITLERRSITEIERAREAAEAAARAKAEFLANMSHEIRTPMNAVIGLTHLLLRTELDGRQRAYLQKIEGSSRHLLAIINDILDFSRLDAGSVTLEQIDFGLERVLANAAGFVTEAARGKGLELVIDIAPGTPLQLVGDPLRLGQILVNFLNNAVKFTTRGEIVLGVSLLALRGQHAELRFEVRDTGIGISGEERARLFQSFQQADTSTTRRFGGTGLGLAIAKRLAELMDGEVGVDSEPGNGSVFWFSVRFGFVGNPAAGWQPVPTLRGAKVLLVASHTATREALAGMLGSMGFATTNASSGVAALEEVARAERDVAPFRLLYVDERLCDMTGHEFASRLVDGAHPWCVLLSAESFASTTPRLTPGIDELVAKPATPSSLLNAAMGALRGKPAARLPTPRAPAALAQYPGRRVLLVEDNDVNREVAGAMLAQHGVAVEMAEHGAEALEKLAAGSYDLVFMDVQMPVMDGLAATRAIRARPGLEGLPVVAMTANALEGDRERCLEAGMNDYVAKPIVMQALAGTLQRWLGEAAGPGSS